MAIGIASKPKPRVVLVAEIEPSPAGFTGGQLTAASTLFASRLAEHVTFIPITTGRTTNPPFPLHERAIHATSRIARYSIALARADAALIFSSGGLSMVEKGLMCVAARLAGRGAIVRYSNGDLPMQCERSVALRTCLRASLMGAHVVCSQGTLWTRYFERFAECRGKILEVRNGIRIGPQVERDRSEPITRLSFLGAMQKEKGIFDALAVFAILKKNHPELHLTMAGGGVDLEAFRREAKSRGLERAISTPGWLRREEVTDLLARSQVFLFPSHSEALPNAVLEAMAASLPVVATRVGSIPDAVREDENGYLLEVGDVEGMVHAVERLACDPGRAHDMGLVGREIAKQRYDIELVWPRYEEAIERALCATKPDR